MADALIDAATTLFAQRGIVAVSVREVANEAGVNVGLVHRYVGTKDDLIRVVLQRAGADLGRDLEGLSDPAYAGGSEELLDSYQRILAHLILEGHDIDAMDLDFPLMRFVIDRVVTETGADDREARMRAMCLIALDLGWRLFEPFVSTAAGLEPDDHAAVQAAVVVTRAQIGRGQ